MLFAAFHIHYNYYLIIIIARVYYHIYLRNLYMSAAISFVKCFGHPLTQNFNTRKYIFFLISNLQTLFQKQFTSIFTHTHTQTYIYIYIYISGFLSLDINNVHYISMRLISLIMRLLYRIKQ